MTHPQQNNDNHTEDYSEAIAACKAQCDRLGIAPLDISVMVWLEFRGYTDWTSLDRAGFVALYRFLKKCHPRPSISPRTHLIPRAEPQDSPPPSEAIQPDPNLPPDPPPEVPPNEGPTVGDHIYWHKVKTQVLIMAIEGNRARVRAPGQSKIQTVPLSELGQRS